MVFSVVFPQIGDSEFRRGGITGFVIDRLSGAASRKLVDVVGSGHGVAIDSKLNRLGQEFY